MGRLRVKYPVIWLADIIVLAVLIYFIVNAESFYLMGVDKGVEYCKTNCICDSLITNYTERLNAAIPK